MPSLVIHEAHPLIAYAINTLLRNESNYEVAAETTNSHDTLQAIEAHQPDLLVMDASLKYSPGAILVLQTLFKMNSPTRTVLIFDQLKGVTVIEAMRWNAKGMVTMDKVLTLLIPCLHKVYAGGEWLELESVRNALDHVLIAGEQAKSLDQILTKREMQLAGLVNDGLSNKLIAHQLDSTEGAIKANLHRIYNKLDIHGRVDLIRLWNQME